MINKIRADHIKLKRAYEPPAPDDGTLPKYFGPDHAACCV